MTIKDLIGQAVGVAMISTAATLVAPAAHAASFYVSGNELRALCTEPARKAACSWYVVGIAESLDDMITHSPEVGDVGDGCAQFHGASVEQLVAATARFVTRNPKLWNQVGQVIVVLALQHEVPCTSKPTWTETITRTAAR